MSFYTANRELCANFFTPQLECPKIVLDHMRVYIYIYIYIYIYNIMCVPQSFKYMLYWKYIIGNALATKIQASASTCKLMNIAIQTLYKVPDATCDPRQNCSR